MLNRIKKQIQTWQWELAVIVTVLTGVWFFTGGGAIEAVGSLAVIITFCHTQVSFRLEEKQKIPNNPHTIECYRFQSRYFLAKEICWLVYFSLLGAWSALVGVFLFLLYPFWRKRWTRHRLSQQRELETFKDILDEWKV